MFKKFAWLGMTLYYSTATGWITWVGGGCEMGWEANDEECPAFLRKAARAAVR